MDNDVRVMACWRVTDLPKPKEGSVRGYYCADCGAEVWIMPRNALVDMKIVCRPCGFQGLKKEGGMVLPASEAHKK